MTTVGLQAASPLTVTYGDTRFVADYAEVETMMGSVLAAEMTITLFVPVGNNHQATVSRGKARRGRPWIKYRGVWFRPGTTSTPEPVYSQGGDELLWRPYMIGFRVTFRCRLSSSRVLKVFA